VTQYLFFLDATADSGGNSLLWTSNGASATKTSVSFNPYAGNNLIVLPAIAPVNKPLSRHGIDAGILLVGNDSAGSDNLFFWDGISALQKYRVGATPQATASSHSVSQPIAGPSISTLKRTPAMISGPRMGRLRIRTFSPLRTI
jgi:hypothetical protein